MSNTDSFIDEVTEEVRRDRLFAIFRKYGWIAVALVILIVGGAAYNEWSKARTRAANEAAGDALVSALGAGDTAAQIDALKGLDMTGDRSVVQAMILAGELQASGDAAGATSVLAPYTVDETLDPVWRDLAVLKSAMAQAQAGDDPQQRIELLSTIATAGAPYRLLAEEQIAIAQNELGQADAAIQGLRAIAQDSEATTALQRRALQLIVALGGDPNQ